MTSVVMTTATTSTSTKPAVSPSGRFLKLTGSERDILILSTTIKVLLFPAYRSTDFEVHRNWLAITHSLPLSKWYYDETSPWTLDYPPFFAYFEYMLSRLAVLVDPAIVELSNLGYHSWSCVVFQRTTVIVTELVLGAAVLKLTQKRSEPQNSLTPLITAASLFLHPGLIIVDHIHFQYNGFLLGILLWSVWAAREERFCLSALVFASLLNLKHIFIYLSPPFLIYLFRAHCTISQPGPFLSQISLFNLIRLGTIVIGTFGASFGPFALVSGVEGIRQILSRLFPFQRGLNHAYWAGNFWAVYSTLDRLLVKYQVARGASIDPVALNSTSRGLIGDTVFGVLPTITPNICLSLTVGFILIIMTRLWQHPTYQNFLKSIVLSAFTSFLFGWHVHEKAALLFLVPLTLFAGEDYYHFRTWLIASVAGTFALFPLLINPAETPIKVLYLIIWLSFVSSILKKNLHRPSLSSWSLLLIKLEDSYLFGFILVQVYCSIIHELIFKNYMGSMEFLPLMIISNYSSLGIIWCFCRLLKSYLV